MLKQGAGRYGSDQYQQGTEIRLVLHRLIALLSRELGSSPADGLSLIHPPKRGGKDPTLKVNAKHLMDKAVEAIRAKRLVLLDPVPQIPRGVERRFGGYLAEPGRASQAIRTLYQRIEEELLQVLQQNHLALNPIGPQLADLAGRLQTQPEILKTFQGALPIRLQPLTLAPLGRSNQARLLICREQISCDLLSAFIDGIIAYARAANWLDESSVQDYRVRLRQLVEEPASTSRRFIEFLDSSLARVRLRFARRLLQRLADTQGHMPSDPGFDLFQEYVQRIEWLIEWIESGEIDGRLDLSAYFGERAGLIDLEEWVNSTSFFSCLPLWPEWFSQAAETRAEGYQPWAVERQIVWRFRVNGRNPETGQSAFVSRILSLAEQLRLGEWGQLDESEFLGIPRRALAQWLFLCLVIPRGEPLTQQNYLAFIEKIFRGIEGKLKQGSRLTLQAYWQEWRNGFIEHSARRIDQARRAMVARLRALGGLRLEDLRECYTVGCRSEVLDPSNIKLNIQSRHGLPDPIRSSTPDEERARWFRGIQVVSDQQALADVFLSFQVEISGEQYGLEPTGSMNELFAQRLLDRLSLPIFFRPYAAEKGQTKDPTQSLKLPHSLEIYYSVSAFCSEDPKERATAALTLALISALVILALIRCLDPKDEIRPQILLLRLHLEEEDALYAAVQAVELMLAHAWDTRSQGIIYQPQLQINDSQYKYRKAGMLAACTAGLPLSFDWPGSLNRLAILTLSARPCSASEEGTSRWLLISRAYRLIRSNPHDPRQGQMALAGMESLFSRSDLAKDSADLIVQWLVRLKQAGFQDILLIYHHLGAKRIGAAALANAFWTDHEVYARLRQRIPEGIYLYLIQRTVLPVTRFATRPPGCSCYEISDLKGLNGLRLFEEKVGRSLLPVYSFATFHVVGDQDEHPQSALCSYFMLSDVAWSELAEQESARARLMGVGGTENVRASLIAGLRMLHFFESEAPIRRSVWVPTLDPYSWLQPQGVEKAGEVLWGKEGGGKLYLSLNAALTHVAECLEIGHLVSNAEGSADDFIQS